MKRLKLVCLLAAIVLLGQAATVEAGIILGTGGGALIGGDLTDPEDDGDPNTNSGYNATFYSTNNPGFGNRELAFNVFDNLTGGTNAKWCCTGTGATGHQLSVDFGPGNAKTIQSFTMSSSNDAAWRDPTQWKIEGSNDNTTWNTLYDSGGASPFGGTRQQVVLFNQDDFTNNTPYQFVRYNVTNTKGGNNRTPGQEHALGEIELFDTNIRPAGRPVAGLIGAVVGGDLTDVGNDGVPDNYAPPNLGGFDATFASTEEPGFGGGQYSYNVFANSVGNKWCCGGTGADGHQLTADFGAGNEKVIKAFTLASAGDAPWRDPTEWKMEGSNDGASWTTLFDSEGTNFWVGISGNRNRPILFNQNDFTNDEAFRYVRYNVNSTAGGNGRSAGQEHQIGEIEFFDQNIVVPGRIIGGLLGGDLTDPENDGVPGAAYDPANGELSGFNAIFSSTNEPGFGGGEFSFNVFGNTLGGGTNKWCCDGPDADGHQVDAELLDGNYILTHFTLSSSNDSPQRDPDDFTIEGSKDGENFDVLFSYDGSAGPLWTARNQTVLFEAGSDFELSTTGYSTFRYNVMGNVSGSMHALGEIEYFGVRVPEPSTWLLTLIGMAGMLFGLRRKRVSQRE